MKKLAAVCIERPVFAAMLILCLVVVGAASYVRLGVDRFPAVDLPSVFIRTMLPGASPEEVEVLSQPADRGSRQHGRGHRRAALDLRRRQLDRHRDLPARSRHRGRNAGRARPVATVLARLPRDVRPPIVAKADNDSSPVMTIALSANRPLRELTEIADKIVKPLLERSAGVGEVEIVGGLERAISVWVDADRLAAYRTADHRGPRRARQPERRPARRQRHRDDARADAAHDGPRRRSEGLRRHRDRHAQRHRRSACATSAGPRTARRSSGRLPG